MRLTKMRGAAMMRQLIESGRAVELDMDGLMVGGEHDSQGVSNVDDHGDDDEHTQWH